MVGRRAHLGPGPRLSRRRVLGGVLLAPVALGACSPVGPIEPPAPDPLLALAEMARADAALAAAAVTAAPELAERVDPLRLARTEHAAALDAEVARLATPVPTPGVPRAEAPTPAAPTPAAPTPAPIDLAGLRAEVQASSDAASAAALDAAPERVGLVASVAACCSAYAAVLT